MPAPPSPARQAGARQIRLDALTGAANMPWLLLVVLGLALMLSLFETTVLAIIESSDLASAKLIGDKAPLRDVLEVCYFASQCVVVGVAVSALPYAKRQADEARNARLTSIYAQFEERWSSPDMQRSRAMLRDILFDYSRLRRTGQFRALTVSKYVDVHLIRLAEENIREYFAIMATADFLEFIGMLESKGYIQLADIAPIIGAVCVSLHDLLAEHLSGLRSRARANYAASGYDRVPDAYRSFTDLSGKFATLFRP